MNASSINSDKSYYKGISTTGIVLSVTGILALLASVIVQLTSINHGSSGQLTIDSAMTNTIALILTPTLILILGAALYYYIYSSERPFLVLFVACLFSYILSNIAIILSLYQVRVT